MLATTGMDIVEVLRGTSAGPWLVAAGTIGGLAAVATVAAAVVWWRAPDRPHAGQPPPAGRISPVAGIALAASSIEAALLLADGAGAGDRWLVVVLARLLLLGVLVSHSRLETDRLLPAAAVPVLGALLLATAALGAVTTAASGQLWWAAVLVGGVTLLLSTGLTLAARLRDGSVRGLTIALVLALGVPVAIWSAPDPLPPHHQERVEVGGLTLDLTVAPLRSGTNEAHLYAFDADGRPTPVSEVHLAVVGLPGSSHRMFEVSPDHHLSYVLELPSAPPWDVSFTLVGPDGRHLEATLHLDAR